MQNEPTATEKAAPGQEGSAAAAQVAADVAAPEVQEKDLRTRASWHSRPAFVLSTVGASIGLGNIWKFPFLTFKHGGVKFIVAYLIAMFVVGIPMLILEVTLGQKMQRGSAGAMRGIAPRLGGVGWAAAYSGFVTCLVYTVLLGVCLVYLMGSGSQPWSDANLVRPMACQTAETMSKSAADIYLWMKVTALWSEDTCSPFRDGLTTGTFAGHLYFATLICWAVIFAALAIGPKALQIYSGITVPLRFLFLIILAAYFGGLNSTASGDGMNYYLGSAELPIPGSTSGQKISFPNSDATLFQDAYTQVFFSIGVCVGTMVAFGSYRTTKQPVILDSLLVAFIDFLFSFIAGFAVWGAIGYLQAKGNPAYNQTNNLGLTFIGIPVAAALADNSGMLGLFCFTLWMSGIDSAMGYCEGFIANIIDYDISQAKDKTAKAIQEAKIKAIAAAAAEGKNKEDIDIQSIIKQTDISEAAFLFWPRWKAAAVVCGAGTALCLLFTSNWGWVLFDLVDHYISAYIIIAIGLCQCISAGWLFERESTACKSPEHRASLRSLALIYWFPTVLTCIYSNFGFPEVKWVGVIIMGLILIAATIKSYRDSGFALVVWYHEIVMCGTDKVAMSISILQIPSDEEVKKSIQNMNIKTNKEKLDFKVNAQKRTWWMLPFEFYFGMTIKYINPACLLFLFFEALANDLKTPYGIAQGSFPALASIYVAIAVVLIIVPMFACAYPESFSHNVAEEFSADDKYETSKRLEIKLRKLVVKKANMKNDDKKQVEMESGPAPAASINAEISEPRDADPDKQED